MDEEKLVRFLNNLSSPNEKEEVLNWLDQPGAEKELEEWMLNKWDNNPVPVVQNEVYYSKLLEKIHQDTIGIGKSKKTRRVNSALIKTGRIAASYLLLLFSVYLLIESWKPVSTDLLTESLPIKTIERKTKAGEKLRITLPDQSMVTVNSLSSIGFNSDFGKKDRIIWLEGEAFFEITPDQDRPFRVQTGGVVTTALGTSFNAYFRDNKVEVSLTEGKVKVSHKINEVELRPGEMAALKENNGEGLSTIKFDTDRTTAWKEGKIRFKSKPLKDIIMTLEKWYGVVISVQGNVDQHRRVSGLFDNESLEEILKGISFSLDLEHTITGKKVTLKPQPPMK